MKQKSIILLSLVLAACGYFTSERDAIASNGKSALDVKRDAPKLKLEDPLPRNLFAELAKAINPAVVSITTTQNVQIMRRSRDPFQMFLEEFYGIPGMRGGRGGSPGQQEQVKTGIGTGFIIHEDGLIVTNNHVVAQGDGILVHVGENQKDEFEAKVVGRDQRSDLALIKISAKKPLPVLALGSSKDLQVGEWVAAFGNPYGHTQTMTKGIISAIGREVKELNRFPFIQTDASINPGNSGGPLVNAQGLVIGVNSAIDARAQGIGFAIPIDQAKTIIAQLEKTGRVRRAYLGVRMQELTPDMAASIGRRGLDAVVAVYVEPDSPAARAGLKEYDIILELGGKKVTSPNELVDTVADVGIGEKRKLKILRVNNDNKAREMTLDVVLGEAPEERSARNRQEQSRPEQGSRAAPHNLGFSVADYSEERARSMGLQAGNFKGPIVTEVGRSGIAGQAGIRVGDMIIDVNRQKVNNARDVVNFLKKGSNMIRLARGEALIILQFGN